MAQGHFSNSNNVDVIIFPFSAKGYQILDLHMKEEILGEIACGDMTLMTDGSKESLELYKTATYGAILMQDITAEISGESEKHDDSNQKWKIPFFITERSIVKNEVRFIFVCITDSKFFAKLDHETFDNIDDAINFTYPGIKDIRIKPDGEISDIPVVRYNNESAYAFCTRLAKSYKKKSIYAFGWEGLLIKDMCGEFDSTGKLEPAIVICDSQFRLSTAPDTRYNKELNYTPSDAWETPDVEDKYKTIRPRFVTSTFNRNAYCIVNRDMSQMTENYYYNDRLQNGGFTTYRVESIKAPHFKLGDALIYTQITEEDEKNSICDLVVCASNEVFFSMDGSKRKSRHGGKFSWICTFIGIKRGKANEKKDEDYDK